MDSRDLEIQKLGKKYRKDALKDWGKFGVFAVSGLLALPYADFIERVQADPQVLEAFEKTYPNLDISDLPTKYAESEESFMGLVNGVKGKYFEIKVAEELNNGGTIGDIHLIEEQKVVFPDSSIQKGWDLQIQNADGSVDELLQLKATNSMSYINNAIEKNPDIRVITNSEIISENPNIISSGFSNEDGTELVSDNMGDLADGMFENVGEFIPGFGLAVAGGKLIKDILSGESMGQVVKEGCKNFLKATLNIFTFGLGGPVFNKLFRKPKSNYYNNHNDYEEYKEYENFLEVKEKEILQLKNRFKLR